MIIVEFKDKLRKLRNEAGLSQEALADIIHISRSAIAKYESGNGKPSEETLKALAFYFEVDVNDLKSDNIIKKENKKTILKWSSIVGIFLLLVSIITISTVRIVNLINKNTINDSTIGETATKLTGVYENIGLLNMDDAVPMEESSSDSNSYIYSVNTHMSFTIEVLPCFSYGSRPIIFVGDIVSFNNSYSSFSNIYYDYTQDKTKYVINFKKEGVFLVEYTVQGYTRVIKFKCDNNLSEWDKYQKDISYFYPWIKDTYLDDITSLRYETSNSSLGPDCFRTIYLSRAKSDLYSAYDFLSNSLWYANSNEIIGDGFSTNTMTYNFIDGTSQSITLTNKSISFTSYVGGLIGYATCGDLTEINGYVKKSFYNGSITSNIDSTQTDQSVTMYSFMGGLVGFSSYMKYEMNYSSGNINNILLKDNYVNSYYDGSGYKRYLYSYVGGLVGNDNFGDYSNSFSNLEINNKVECINYYRSYINSYLYNFAYAYSYVGGAIGKTTGGKMQQSYSSSCILSDTSAKANYDYSHFRNAAYTYSYVGMLVGYATTDSTNTNIINCFGSSDSFIANASVDAYKSDYYTLVNNYGGLCGNDTNITVDNCYRYSNIDSNINLGTSTSLANLKSVNFITNNLGWDTSIWLLENGKYPSLK